MDTRLKGLLKLIGGGVLFAFALSVTLKNQLADPAHSGSIFKVIMMATPGAFAIVGFVELLTGLEFLHIAKKWDELRGWQRGVLGLLVVALSIVIMMGGMILFA